MKKIFCLLIMMMFAVNVSAAIELEPCTTEKMNNLKEMVNKMEFNYTYEMKKDKDVPDYTYPEFTITIKGLTKDLKALIINDFYSLDYKEIINDGNGNGKISGFKQGEKVSITMKAYTPDKCSTKTVAVKQIKLPYYNQFYDKDYCLTNPNFKYCQEFTEEEVTNTKYYKELEKYEKENETTEPVVENKSDNTLLFIGVGVGVILVIGIVVVILVRRKKYEL